MFLSQIYLLCLSSYRSKCTLVDEITLFVFFEFFCISFYLDSLLILQIIKSTIQKVCAKVEIIAPGNFQHHCFHRPQSLLYSSSKRLPRDPRHSPSTSRQ